MALKLPLLFPQQKGLVKRLALRACGVLTLPLVVVLAGIGTLSLKGNGGDDCLGYTVVANNPKSKPSAGISHI